MGFFVVVVVFYLLLKPQPIRIIHLSRGILSQMDSSATVHIWHYNVSRVTTSPLYMLLYAQICHMHYSEPKCVIHCCLGFFLFFQATPDEKAVIHCGQGHISVQTTTPNVAFQNVVLAV